MNRYFIPPIVSAAARNVTQFVLRDSARAAQRTTLNAKPQEARP